MITATPVQTPVCSNHASNVGFSRLRTALAARQSRARARYIARRAHALWVSDRLAEVDTSTLDRLDRWLAS